MQRIALGIEYSGANYAGWQRQHSQPSVQEHLEKAISKVASHLISVVCAGRTDAGVHASAQVVHFDTISIRNELAWIRGVNTYLPHDIRVLWSKSVSNEFNARRSATSRRYCYIIANRVIKPGIMHQAMTWIFGFLDVSSMQEGAHYLLGHHDFSSFRATQCQANSPYRTIHSINVSRQGENIIIDITANAFLHHMVRNIVGTLIAVGQNKQKPLWVQEVLLAKDRRHAGYTAPPEGLYLANVNYPTYFEIPSQNHLPWFLMV